MYGVEMMGRLIDADLLIEKLQNSSDNTWAKSIPNIRNWWPHSVQIKDNIVSVIRDSPTVYSKERVVGEWLVERDGNRLYHVCSVCSEYPLVNRMKSLEEETLTPFCPNCGSEMKGGDLNG